MRHPRLQVLVAVGLAAALTACSSTPGPLAGLPTSAPSTTAPAATTTAPSGPTTPLPTTTQLPPTTRPPPTTLRTGPPPAVTAPAFIPVAGDGKWLAAGRLVDHQPATYLTTLHQSGQPIAVAWMDPRRLRFTLFAGTSQPLGPWPNDGSVAPADQPNLAATFNSGFQLKQSNGGWYVAGHTADPLVNGAASLVIRADGTATVGEWGRDLTLTPDVYAVRQNLQLLVDGGAPTPAASSTTPIVTWGDPLHENVSTWRSAIGVDATGALVYVAGPAMTPLVLAQALVAVGVQRAMELDINPEWVSYDTFTGVGPSFGATKLLPAMNFPADHFLHPYWRDFVAAFVTA